MNAHLFTATGIFHPEGGGPATYLHELLPHLQQRGWEVRLLTYGDAPAAGYPYPVARVRRRALPLRTLAYARAARPLMQWADVSYIHTLSLPLLGGGKAARVVKIVGDLAWERSIRRGWIPADEDIDAFQTGRYGLAATFAKMYRARQVRRMDGVIVPGEYLRRMVVGWGVAPERVRVIYNALPPGFDAPQLSQAEARAQLGLPDAPLLLAAARLVRWKGIDHLITALQHVRDVHLLIAGEGPLRAALQAQAQQMRVAGRVTFLGHVPHEQMPLYMRAADYVALYSGYEGLSHTLLESLRAGTPVIASDRGGNPEVVRHGVNGLLVPYVDVEALAAALVTAFAPGARAELAANTEVGMERFDFARMVAETDAALRAFV